MNVEGAAQSALRADNVRDTQDGIHTQQVGPDATVSRQDVIADAPVHQRFIDVRVELNIIFKPNIARSVEKERNFFLIFLPSGIILTK